MGLVVPQLLIKESVVFWLWGSSYFSFVLQIVGQKCVIFAQVRTCITKKLGPTWNCLILRRIGSTTTTDQRECGLLIVGFFIFPVPALNRSPKWVIFSYFAQVRTCKIKKLSPTKSCLILYGIGCTTTTDQRECVFWFFGFTGPDLSKIGKNPTFLAKHEGEIRRAPQSKNHTFFDE